MQTIKQLRPHQSQFCRYFSTGVRLCRGPVYSTVDEVLNLAGPGPGYRIYPHKVFYKLLFKPKKKFAPTFYSKPPVGAPCISIETAASVVTPGHYASSRRVTVLNKLFMRYIPEIMTTSEFGVELYNRDIQISHVKINQDYSLVKVYWLPKGTEEDDVTEKLLEKISHPLRRELISLRVMGIVPKIRFCKNKFHALMAEVDRRLKIADFGEDFVPTIFTPELLNKQFRLQAPLSMEVKDSIQKLENEEPIGEDEELLIPDMKMDMFNLNYLQIQREVTVGMRNKRISRLSISDEKTLLGDNVVKQIPFNVEAQRTPILDKRALLSYVRKVRIERKKILKEQAKELKEQALHDSLLFQNSNEETEDELYLEFVENAFEDNVEDLDDAYEMKHEQ